MTNWGRITPPGDKPPKTPPPGLTCDQGHPVTTAEGDNFWLCRYGHEVQEPTTPSNP